MINKNMLLKDLTVDEFCYLMRTLLTEPKLADNNIGSWSQVPEHIRRLGEEPYMEKEQWKKQ